MRQPAMLAFNPMRRPDRWSRVALPSIGRWLVGKAIAGS